MARAKRGVMVRNLQNKSRDFGEYQQWAGSAIITVDGKDHTFLFTERDLAMLIGRSEKNPEDRLKRRYF